MTQATRRSSVVVAQHAAPFAILVTWTTLLLGCTVRRTNDYVFTVAGIVTARDDVLLEAADVTLDVSGPVYEGIDLVKTRHVLTNNGGAFVFSYIAHKRGVPYTITARKDGFEPQTVSGSAPSEGDHKIRLKSVAESDKGASARDPLKTRYSLPTTHQMLPRVAQ